MLLCNLFAPLLIYCLSAPNASFCVLHENGPAPFLQLVPCFASSVEGAREPSQEERVLLLLRALGQACSAQQPAAPGGQKLPPSRPPTPPPRASAPSGTFLVECLQWVTSHEQLPRHPKGWISVRLPQRGTQLLSLLPSEQKLHPLQQGLYFNLGRRGGGTGAFLRYSISAYRSAIPIEFSLPLASHPWLLQSADTLNNSVYWTVSVWLTVLFPSPGWTWTIYPPICLSVCLSYLPSFISIYLLYLYNLLLCLLLLLPPGKHWCAFCHYRLEFVF